MAPKIVPSTIRMLEKCTHRLTKLTKQNTIYHILYFIIIIIMYIYHALINALRAHMIHINLNMIFYTHVKHSPTKTIYIKYYLENKI